MEINMTFLVLFGIVMPCMMLFLAGLIVIVILGYISEIIKNRDLAVSVEKIFEDEEE